MIYLYNNNNKWLKLYNNWKYADKFLQLVIQIKDLQQLRLIEQTYRVISTSGYIIKADLENEYISEKTGEHRSEDWLEVWFFLKFNIFKLRGYHFVGKKFNYINQWRLKLEPFTNQNFVFI